MSGPSSSTSRAQSISSGSSIGPPEWTCVNCQEEDGAAVELVESDGNMVCPQCAMIDSMASSARGHVDVNEISGQIMDKTQSLQSLESAWNDRSNWHSRTFMVSPAVLNQQNSADSIDSCGCGACYTHIFGRLQLQLQPSEWRATLVQRSQKGRVLGWRMETHVDTYQDAEIGSAVKYGCQAGIPGDEPDFDVQQAQGETFRVAYRHSKLHQGR
jgi:hypothetical protein